jgi:hypothetical protein
MLSFNISIVGIHPGIRKRCIGKHPILSPCEAHIRRTPAVLNEMIVDAHPSLRPQIVGSTASPRRYRCPRALSRFSWVRPWPGLPGNIAPLSKGVEPRGRLPCGNLDMPACRAATGAGVAAVAAVGHSYLGRRVTEESQNLSNWARTTAAQLSEQPHVCHSRRCRLRTAARRSAAGEWTMDTTSTNSWDGCPAAARVSWLLPDRDSVFGRVRPSQKG